MVQRRWFFYADGPQLHWDYYNSYVIQPMLLAVLDATSKTTKAWADLAPVILHARAAMLSFKSASSHLTAPFPPSPLHYLSLWSLPFYSPLSLCATIFPEPLPPEQVRCALWAVINKL